MPTRPAYPRHWEADIVARDGATMHVRPILPADAPGLQALHLAQSERSRFFRFFGHRGALTEAELERFTHVDHRDRVALVVTDRDGGPLLAFGCYDAVDARTAEVAFYVALPVLAYDPTSRGSVAAIRTNGISNISRIRARWCRNRLCQAMRSCSNGI